MGSSRFGAEEKAETAGDRERTHTRRRSGVSDGLGGVVFGGDTQEFREAEEAAARMGRGGGGGSATAAAFAPSAPPLQDVVL